MTRLFPSAQTRAYLVDFEGGKPPATSKLALVLFVCTQDRES
jgi:hypothetical protein